VETLRRMVVCAALAAFAGAGATSCAGSQEASPGASSSTVAAPDSRPNVLVLLWDTVRADSLSLYGATRPTTPRLEAFARGAAVYEKATAPDMWTLPTHAGMFTGLWGTSHGAHATNRWLDDDHHTLAEILSEQGYATVAITANIVVSPLTNLAQGFGDVITTFRSGTLPKETPFQVAAREATRAKLIERDASTEMSPAWSSTDPDDGWAKAVYKDAAPVSHKRLTSWIDEHRDAPWFAYVNMMEAHTPRVPSLASRKALLDDDTLELGLQTDASLFTEVAYMAGRRDYSPAQLAAMRGVYDAAVRDLDTATGDLLDDLKARGDLDNTLVVIVSDHGEALGEHRLMEHRYNVYEPLVHVPLVVSHPTKVTPGRVATRVSTVDVFGTVLDAAGIPMPRNPAVRSTSLLAAQRPVGAVFVQMLDPFASSLSKVRSVWPDLDTSRLTRTYGVVYDGDTKFIRCSDGAHELYDLLADPGEARNLFAEQPERAEALLQRLDGFEAGLPTYTPSPRRGRKSKAAMTEAARSELQALGYLDPDDDPAARAPAGSGH
jgi:arylsulfatase A-like enzyme